ncbi:MAG TPA: hypothetical protein DEH78_05950 [Solibacterales bacterium]|nr:hypothetical protein [Bryobacterales bacterium]
MALLGDATPLRLTSDPAPETWPAWSPDGRQVAFRRAGETPGIYTVPALGGPARLVASFITNGPHSWSPKGDWIALAATTAAGQVPGLYLAPAQGGAPRRLPLPEDQVRRLSGAVFSPDGRSIAFVVSRGVVINAIYIQNLTGDYEASGAPRLVAQPNHAVQGIAWTAGQDALVYAGGMGNSRLWKVAADGKAPPEVIELAGLRALYPTLSRDGLRLLYSYSLQDVDIVRLPEAEAPSPQVASTSIEMSPSLSPDGARIAFSSTRSGDPEVWVADADGANAVQVTNKVGVYQGSPSWSPDGRSLAFDSQRRDGLWDIYVTGLSGGVPRKVAEPGYAPSWSRDGKWIYFGSNRTGRDEIWRVAAGGASSPERLTSAGGAVPVESLDGQTLYYVRRAVAGVPLLAKKLPDGPEHEVAPHATRAFAVTAQGIYFMSAKPGNPVDSLCFYDYAKGAVRTVRRLEGASPFGLAASPDGKTLLAALALRRGADLMMIENFEP